MDMTASSQVLSPTGRLTKSEPELQHFPGTPQALAQERRMKAALAQGGPVFVDFSRLEEACAKA